MSLPLLSALPLLPRKVRKAAKKLKGVSSRPVPSRSSAWHLLPPGLASSCLPGLRARREVESKVQGFRV